MAVGRSLGSNSTPENETPRDFAAEQEAAIKERIQEYKTHGRDTEDFESKLRKLQNAKKGRRRGGEAEDVDRDDSVDGMASQEAELIEREKGKLEPPGQGTPDQLSEKAPDPEAVAGPTPDVPDQKSPWPTNKPEHAITQPPLPKDDGPQGSAKGDGATKGSAEKGGTEKSSGAKKSGDKGSASKG